MWIGFNNVFADKYNNLKLNQRVSEGQTGYRISNDVVLFGDIASALNYVALDTTLYQSHMDQLVTEIIYLEETNKILGYHIKQLSKTNVILSRQEQDEKKSSNKY